MRAEETYTFISINYHTIVFQGTLSAKPNYRAFSVDQGKNSWSQSLHKMRWEKEAFFSCFQSQSLEKFKPSTHIFYRLAATTVLATTTTLPVVQGAVYSTAHSAGQATTFFPVDEDYNVVVFLRFLWYAFRKGRERRKTPVREYVRIVFLTLCFLHFLIFVGFFTR